MAAGDKKTYEELERQIKELKKQNDFLHRYYQSIVDNSVDAILLTAPDGNIFFVNQAACDLFQKTRQEIIDGGRRAIVDEEDDRLPKALNNREKTGKFVGELNFKKNDGTIFSGEVSSAIYKDAERQPLTSMSIRDVTKRKQMEKALKESENKFRTIFSLSQQAIALSEIETGKIVQVNNKLCELTQYSEEELVGKTTPELGFYSEKDRRKFTDELKGSGLVDGLEMEFTVRDGSKLTALMFASIIQISGLFYVLTVFFDLTKQKRLEEQLRQTHKMEAIGSLAGGIAHEFNNMLGIIIGNTELAIDDIPDWSPAKGFISEIRTASLRAKDVVRKLLSVARKTAATRRPLQISIVVRESLDLLRRTIPPTIDIKSDLSCATEMITGDPTELSQILMNLCTNSVHAMREQTGLLEVNLEAIQLDRQSAMRYESLKPGDYARLTVKDTGEGIEPELIDRVFDPYFTTKDVDEGLGMGLAVVHGLVNNHAGGIKIESEVGKGTTVEVLFPLIGEQEVGTEKTDTPRTGTERILFVDDEASLVIMVTQMLERSGYEVVGKTSSSEGLKLLKANPERFDLVITDMAMPDMAGDRLAQEIIQIRQDIPVIICTGHSDHMDEKKAKELGIKALVMKPLGKKDLAKTVRKVLDEAICSNSD